MRIVGINAENVGQRLPRENKDAALVLGQQIFSVRTEEKMMEVAAEPRLQGYFPHQAG